MAMKEEEILALGWKSVEQYEAYQAKMAAARVMNVFKVTFEDGDWLTTGFNGTLADAEKYYLGQTFNVGLGPDDNLQTAVKVELLSGGAS